MSESRSKLVNVPEHVVDDPSRSRTDHGASDRSVPGRSGPIRKQQGTGELCRDDARRIFQWEATSVGWPDQTRQSPVAISVE
jgi:hypothetical protein